MKVGIIRDIFKDKDWCSYSIYKKGKDPFGIVDRDSKYYDCFDEFEYYFGADFLTPMIFEESIREEYYYNIKILKYGEDIYIHLYYKNEI